MRYLSLIATVLLILTGNMVQAAGTAPTNVLLARGRTEPSIAVDPRHPSTIVVSSNTDYDTPLNGGYPTAYFASRDGGKSFSFGTAPQIWPYTVGADTTMQIDRNGTVFYSYLGETNSYCSGGRSAVVVTHSIDGGRSFRAPRIVDSDSADDKPNMTVRSRPGKPSELFLTWTRWHDASGASDVWFARSLDGGVTFSRPALLYSSTLNNVGTVPVTGPHGRLYVFWNAASNVPDTRSARARIMMRSSSDDGRHFAPARAISPFFSQLPVMTMPGSLRNLTMPAAASSRGGSLYVAWAQMSRGGANILLSRSTDGGSHWSVPRRVNDSAHLDRFMPALSVLSSDSAGLAFYDRRRGASTLDVYAARVSFAHGFRASANVRVSRGRSPVDDITYLPPGSTCFLPGRFFGDYIGAAPGANGTLCVVWADTQLQTAGETDIWFARVHWNT